MPRVVLVTVLLAVLTGCVRNPATGQRQLALISEKEEQDIGQQAAEEVRQGVGLVEDAELQGYVAGVGKTLAADSERAALPWSFQVVDDASVNAFALPGGPIFITRGMLAHMGSEAELAAVLGHEIGHVTARHAVSRISQQQLAQVGLGLGTVLAPDLAQYAGLASVGLQLLFLQYSRDQESQADVLGLRYMLRERYDPRAMEALFRTLSRVEQSAGGRLPVWLSTHPTPEGRLEEVDARITALRVDLSTLREERQPYLRQLEGLAYGPDPRQGYFEGRRFFHPALRFQVDFPPDWTTSNAAEAVVAESPERDATVGLVHAGTLAPEEALRRFLAREGVQPLTLPTEGLPPAASYFEARAEQGAVQGVTVFVSRQGKTLQLLGYTRVGSLQRYDKAFRATFNSFSELTDPEKLDVEPAHIELMTLAQPTTLAVLQERAPSAIPLEELARLNGVSVDETLPAGRIVKRVTGGRPAR